MAERIIIDTETTGLNAIRDEIIELAIIDADTSVPLYDRRYGTAYVREWPAAQDINHISPDDVANLDPLQADDPAAALISAAKWIGGYNVAFDLAMLRSYSIQPDPEAEIVDIMELDAVVCGEVTAEGYRWRKLGDAAKHWGYNYNVLPPGCEPHTAYGDCLAALHVYRSVMTFGTCDLTPVTRHQIIQSRERLREIERSLHLVHEYLLERSMDIRDTPERVAELGSVCNALNAISGDAAALALRLT